MDNTALDEYSLVPDIIPDARLRLRPGECLVLASASPRRATLLAEKGIAFTAQPVDFDEGTVIEPVPARRVILLAAAKAMAASVPEDSLVLGADTTVVLGARVFGKPRTLEAARASLRALSGRHHCVMSGVCIRRGTACAQWVTRTRVAFKMLDDSTIERYISLVNPLDKAGGYGLQEHPELIIADVLGSRTNVIGLPMEAVLYVLGRPDTR